MTLTDRTRKRLRLLLSIVVVSAVLATSSEVREGICKVAVMVVGGRRERTRVSPVRDLRKTYARPSILLGSQVREGQTSPVSERGLDVGLVL